MDGGVNMIVTKVCLSCGTTFFGFSYSDNSYCKACYAKNYRCKHKRTSKNLRTCQNCGAVFPSNNKNKSGLCKKYMIKKYQHEYYCKVTKIKRALKRKSLKDGVSA